MKRLLYTTVILFLSCTIIRGQDISSEIRCYYVHSETGLDTLYNIEYTIWNKTTNSKMIMLTEDNITEYPMKKLIYRRLIKRYGDLSFAQLAWDNIENLSNHSLIPEFFIKKIRPNDTFRITLVLKNRNPAWVNMLFSKHILVVDVAEIDNENMVFGFLSAIEEHHFEYPYSSVVIPWYTLRNFFNL